jgi:hypothetical protein
MAEPAPTPAPINLQELAQKLRGAKHLGLEAQQAVADLLEELARALAPSAVPPEEKAHLAESAAHLAEALHQGEEAGALGTALERFEAAVARAEARAPMASGVARRLIETLANWGI